MTTTAAATAADRYDIREVPVGAAAEPRTEDEAMDLMRAVAARFNITFRALGETQVRATVSEMFDLQKSATFDPQAWLAAHGLSEDEFHDRAVAAVMGNEQWANLAMGEDAWTPNDEDPVQYRLETLAEYAVEDLIAEINDEAAEQG